MPDYLQFNKFIDIEFRTFVIAESGFNPPVGGRPFPAVANNQQPHTSGPSKEDATRKDGLAMKKEEATRSQISKILDYMEGVTSEQVQNRLPAIAEAIRNAETAEYRRVKSCWDVIRSISGFKGIIITVPLQPCKDIGDGDRYQVRVWQQNHGAISSNGHVDIGRAPEDAVFLFETSMPTFLNPCTCCYPPQFGEVGIDMNWKKGNREWLLETKSNLLGDKCYVIRHI